MQKPSTHHSEQATPGSEIESRPGHSGSNSEAPRVSEAISRRTALRQMVAGTTALAFTPAVFNSKAEAASAESGRRSIKLALVGGAHIHAPGFANMMSDSPYVETKYVWDPSNETARRRQGVTGGEIVENLDTIWEDPEVDGVVICSQTVHHVDLVGSAVNAGKHLFVEKPVGMNGREAARIAEMVERGSVIFQTGYFMRSRGINQKIRSLIRDGSLGEITRLRLSNVHNGALGGWFDGEWRWMADVDQAGVGAFGDLGSHVMDLLLWFMEGDSPIDCTGCVDTVLNRYPGCDEYGEGMVRFESGAVATIAGGWVDRTNPNEIEVTGTQGHARVTRGELFLTIPEQGLTGAAPAGDLPENRDHPLELFFAAVGGVRDLPLVSAREAALTNKVITGIYRAHENRTWVDL